MAGPQLSNDPCNEVPSNASLTRPVLQVERSNGASDAIAPATLLLQLFMQLPPERQEVAMEVVRGLVALG